MSRSDKAKKRHAIEPAIWIVFLQMIFDPAVVAMGAAVAHLMTFGWAPITSPYWAAILFAVVLTRIIYQRVGLYASWRARSLFTKMQVVSAGWLTVVTGMILTGFLFNIIEVYSRQWIVLWAVFGLLLLVASHAMGIMLLRFLRSVGVNHKRLVIVGAGEWGAEVLRRIQSIEWAGYDIVGFFDHRPEKHGTSVRGIEVLGGYGLLPGFVEENQIDDVWICLPLSASAPGAGDHIEHIRYLLRHQTANQRIIPRFADISQFGKPIEQTMGLPAVNLSVSPMRGLNLLVKTLEDRVIAAIILLLISPLLLMIAIVVKLTSPGPVIFKQLRHGWDGKPIRVYKFRTMFHESGSGSAFVQASRNDTRITPVGAFLRRTSLDELPQFFNVIQGKMSVVGPRPHAIEHNHIYMDKIDSYMKRHAVKPGITGWAQVNGWRGETEILDKMKKRIEYDLYYIENWSFWFDIKIILLTVFRGFVHKNAY